MSLPTASGRPPRQLPRFPSTPGVYAQSSDPHGPPDPGGPNPPDPHGPTDPGSFSDLQWIVAWVALGLLLWLMARSAIGYRILYYVLLLGILLVLLTQFAALTAVLAPFKSLGPGLTGSGGSGSNTVNRAAQDPRATSPNRGPRSRAKSPAAGANAAESYAERGATLASF